jgi:hypothetical protein
MGDVSFPSMEVLAAVWAVHAQAWRGGEWETFGKEGQKEAGEGSQHPGGLHASAMQTRGLRPGVKSLIQVHIAGQLAIPECPGLFGWF